jgi:hypothetical protein
VGDQVKVKVIGVDKERKRISLSKRACEENVGGATGRPAGQAVGGAGQNAGARTSALGARTGAQAHSGAGRGAGAQGHSGGHGAGQGRGPSRGGDRGDRGGFGQDRDYRETNKKQKDTEPGKSYSMEDLLAKFNANKG